MYKQIKKTLLAINGGEPARKRKEIVEVNDTFTIDPIEIEKNITNRTRAIIPVHMRGVPCDMDSIMQKVRFKSN